MTHSLNKPFKQITLFLDPTGSSKETQTNNHILPALIQTIGEKGFLEGASRFPVLYLDSDLCVFEFQITGTKICAKRI